MSVIFLKLSSESGNRSALNEVIDSYFQLSTQVAKFERYDLIIRLKQHIRGS